MRSNRNQPLGPGGTYKTGQRVPATGLWMDQHGQTSHFEEHRTFPTCIGRKRECAYRSRVRRIEESA
ncbi:hypothetical protein [Mycobacterium sp. 852013-50091_SCH5140682]|uniref:hypothetical protein n=1 Tax=Mycobacterium sp. 852013-50091_SCH5140682 TaxID=1834109 RepID=UPI0012EA87E1|nr:hypothetical protein [Mycobacterium sp. 852013-50091_SCH5140682]